MPTAETTVQACPECEGQVGVESEVRAGEIVECPECAAELEVVGVAPVLLALAPEADEDWGE
ncbi:lysine biosynthesis protein LysW [Streptomyces sp. SID14478]|uniref:lysine biosynthesis protein LysW n=1 Tax=Streptomyces sp. SID14478 TaxID=2706073 RepID=UPI0013DBAF3F|nr:lysine biosynthesis protein LysW [Streptomyces sp. SID14478]NEB74969.1 lysine biosynthesis protein LysW [Streptomyces sp. SID14478]